MPDVALIAVHGMGENDVEYAAPLRKRLARKMGPRFDAAVDFRSVYYKAALQKNQQVVWNRIAVASKVHYDDLRRFVLFGLGDAAGLETRKEIDGSVYELAQAEIARALLAAYASHGDVPVVFLSHSLGCQVLSNYIYDAQKAEDGGKVGAGIWKNIDRWSRAALGRVLNDDEKNFISAGTCMGWITTGCNIPVFVAAHKEMEIIPIAPPTPPFRWLNLYDPDDVLGWPLAPLSAAYAEMVEDRPMNAGQGALKWILKSWNPWSHSAYWSDDDVLDPLASMLRQLTE
jgi:hypothetical protein